MYIESVTISNLRTISEASLSLRHADDIRPSKQGSEPSSVPNVNLFLGNNGAGKSTMLRGMALSVLTPVIDSSGYVPFSMVRREGKEYAKEARVSAKLRLHDQDLEGRRRAGEDDIHELTTRIVRKRSTEFLVQEEIADSSLWEGMYDNDSPAFLLVG
jgi:predicted ATPase